MCVCVRGGGGRYLVGLIFLLSWIWGLEMRTPLIPAPIVTNSWIPKSPIRVDNRKGRNGCSRNGFSGNNKLLTARGLKRQLVGGFWGGEASRSVERERIRERGQSRHSRTRYWKKKMEGDLWEMKQNNTTVSKIMVCCDLWKRLERLQKCLQRNTLRIIVSN